MEQMFLKLDFVTEGYTLWYWDFSWNETSCKQIV